MRPSVVYPLFAQIDALNGIGQKYMKLVSSLCGSKVVDLLWHMPSNIIDRRCGVPLSMAQNGQLWTGQVCVVEHAPPKTKNTPIALLLKMPPNSLFSLFLKLTEIV